MTSSPWLPAAADRQTPLTDSPGHPPADVDDVDDVDAAASRAGTNPRPTPASMAALLSTGKPPVTGRARPVTGAGRTPTSSRAAAPVGNAGPPADTAVTASAATPDATTVTAAGSATAAAKAPVEAGPEEGATRTPVEAAPAKAAPTGAASTAAAVPSAKAPIPAARSGGIAEAGGTTALTGGAAEASSPTAPHGRAAKSATNTHAASVTNPTGTTATPATGIEPSTSAKSRTPSKVVATAAFAEPIAPIAPGPAAASEPATITPTPPADTARPATRAPLITAAEYALAGATVLVLAGVVLVSQLIDPSPLVHTVAQFVHLVCVVVGLGSVLAVDWFGLRWRLGRGSVESVVATAGALAVPIWLGLGGLLVSGMLLEPDLSTPLTVVKVVMVAATGVAGVLALAISRRLAIRTAPSARLLRAGLGIAVLSQVGWWTATVIGFLNRS
ncbi:hypothetical protein [Jiangella asiatica]|uniref:Uncharacterized protein n=1 Tax=Jiangella asiatica TaxID=2530372 RepID=A0A4R5CR26_9ACTN|nr:hypothetical protein [Jiangella asiatica]TDE01291.1 hypothetical protein E1269_23300 [Jiangella asiatica]